ncbi:MAG: HAMP domain-containing histidine kinase [Lawsonibacter sp.]|nr:HAMP domain-containing histidine kinase [Lawsonibacter sp.]
MRLVGRLLGYLDELVGAAEELARPDGGAVSLSADLAGAQDYLNQVRDRASRDARAAREAEQRKNDLIVYLAHDLKTPLTSVIGYLTLLRDEPELSPAFRARYTGVALEKALRLEELINEFFDITRFNLTRLELERRPCDLTRMLQQIASEFQPQFGEKNLTCRLDLPPVLEYGCDPDKLARVFDNLMRNAFYYSFPDTQVEISARWEGGEAVICFANRGPSIPPEKLERIFEQFFRLDSSRASRTGGAGLGLAIAKEIVELHGGSIRAGSAGERVTFTVRLPLSPEEGA